MKLSMTSLVWLAMAFCFLCLTVNGGQLVPNWEALAGELSVSPPSLVQLSNDSPHFRYLLRSRNLEAFREMTSQGKPIVVRLAGFEGLMALEPETGLECGINIALTENPSFGLAALYEAVAGCRPGPRSDQALTEAFRTTPFHPDSALSLILHLPSAVLRRWFEASDRGWVLPSYEALVLGRLFAECKREKVAPSERMKATLSKFAYVPGEPRITFLMEADESAAVYREAMGLALEDGSTAITQLRALAYAKRAYIKRNISLATLNLSEARRKALQTFLEEGNN